MMKEKPSLEMRVTWVVDILWELGSEGRGGEREGVEEGRGGVG